MPIDFKEYIYIWNTNTRHIFYTLKKGTFISSSSEAATYSFMYMCKYMCIQAPNSALYASDQDHIVFFVCEMRHASPIPSAKF